MNAVETHAKSLFQTFNIVIYITEVQVMSQDTLTAPFVPEM